ncbi:MAG TPA: trypsin-like peptidase domain-containing protein [Gemmatimonadaceae bacterium]|nr:trypsin-like peptidase domain-containing protein [Gemmatimonadaceae bacterium]
MRRLLLLCALAGCTGGDAQTVRDVAPPAKQVRAPSSARKTAITDAVARVSPSVVTIQTEVVERSNDPFDAFFGGNAQQKVPGLGTGFVIRSDGVIVTNAHVVAGASQVSVALRDGTSYVAKVLGVDEVNDLAVVKIPATGLPVAPLGSSDDLLIGEWAIAIGNPYGFYLGNPEPSVTVGVVSGVGRNLVGQAEGNGVYVDMIQTDAAINPGNSGGPLVDAVGDVIGVNSSIYSPSGGSVGLGFAIPINRVKRVADDLLAHGSVRRPWVGVKLKLPETNNPRDALNSGVVIRTIVPGSPAASAGLQPGDMIEKAGTRSLRNPYDWEALLLDLRVGQAVVLTVKRGGREIPVTVTVGDLPEVSAQKVEVLRELELVTLTPAIRSERGIRSEHGAVIYKLSDRVAEDLGIQTGDVIVQINRTPITSADEAAKALNYYGGRGPIRMFFERSGQVFSTDFSIQ